MLRPAVLGLILACAVSLSCAVVVLENKMPVKWAETPALLTEMPTEVGVVNPDPWNYLHRMSFYRLIIEATNPKMASMGTNTTDSPIWALTMQLGWLLNSGRLADPTSTTNCGLPTGDPMCISPKSWYSCVSYFTSAIPFLSAVQQGIMEPGVQVKLQKAEGAEEFCTTYTDCKASYGEVVSKWDTFFQDLKAESQVSDSERKDTILGFYWQAQMASVNKAVEICSARRAHYSAEELAFADGWLYSMEFISSARFHSNVENSYGFISALPSRILKEGDRAPNIADLSQEENNSLTVASHMKALDDLIGGQLMNLWRKAMCSVDTRQKGNDLLREVRENPRYATLTFQGIVIRMATGC